MWYFYRGRDCFISISIFFNYLTNLLFYYWQKTIHSFLQAFSIFILFKLIEVLPLWSWLHWREKSPAVCNTLYALIDATHAPCPFARAEIICSLMQQIDSQVLCISTRNGCFAYCSLVKVVFFSNSISFTTTSRKRKKKHTI